MVAAAPMREIIGGGMIIAFGVVGLWISLAIYLSGTITFGEENSWISVGEIVLSFAIIGLGIERTYASLKRSGKQG